jgi:hypothetical protein
MKMWFERIILAMCLGVATTALNGCVGLPCSSLPPRLDPVERAKVKDAHLKLTVGVATNDPGGELVIARLRRTKLFDAVDYAVRLPHPPQVLAKWEHTPYGTASIPIYTLLTFGIIPTTVPEPYSFGCTFYSPRKPERTISVEYLYDSRSTLGWVAGIMALSPNIVLTLWRGPDEHPRFYDHLSLTILNHSEEIMNLAK